MVRQLRIVHRYAWMVIAALLPAGVIFAWLVIPNHIPTNRVFVQKIELLPVIKTNRESSRYCINLRSNQEGTAWQLEWKNKKALTVPSAVIYEAVDNTRDITKLRFIGRIDSRGDYLFSLPGETSFQKPITYILFDFIHQRTVDSIHFNHPL